MYLDRKREELMPIIQNKSKDTVMETVRSCVEGGLPEQLMAMKVQEKIKRVAINLLKEELEKFALAFGYEYPESFADSYAVMNNESVEVNFEKIELDDDEE